MRAVIFANGELPDQEAARSLLRSDDTILCADGGTRHALALGLRPALVIGDLDSLSRQEIRGLTGGDIQMERFPSDKDETDLSLAMTQAVNLGCSTVLIIGGLGGRLDQTLANVGLLAHPAFARHDVRLDDGLEEVLICRDRAVIHGSIGDVVSLLAWTGTVGGVRTENLRWPLLSESLEPGHTRGISNLMTAENAAVSVASGLLLVVHRRERHSLSTSPTSSSRSLQE